MRWSRKICLTEGKLRNIKNYWNIGKYSCVDLARDMFDRWQVEKYWNIEKIFLRWSRRRCVWLMASWDAQLRLGVTPSQNWSPCTQGWEKWKANVTTTNTYDKYKYVCFSQNMHLNSRKMESQNDFHHFLSWVRAMDGMLMKTCMFFLNQKSVF